MIKNTGISRPVDELGRVVIPKEIRKALNINIKDRMSVSVDGNKIILQKVNDCCTICGGADDLVEMDGKCICKNCISKIKDRL